MVGPVLQYHDLVILLLVILGLLRSTASSLRLTRCRRTGSVLSIFVIIIQDDRFLLYACAFGRSQMVEESVGCVSDAL